MVESFASVPDLTTPLPLELLVKIVFSNALFPSPWHPEHGARRARVGL